MTEGTLRAVGDRWELRIERRLAHPPAKVWRAVTDPDELARWFPARVGGERALGAKLTFTDGDVETRGVVTVWESGQVFAFDWNGELLRWEVVPDGAGCRLVFTHQFTDRPGAATFAAGWDACLDTMFGETGGWSAERHDHYVDVFGLREGTTETTGTGWTVRFVRQLTAPAADVWPLLTADPGPMTPLHTPETVPEQRLTYPWADGTVTWDLTPGPGGKTRVFVEVTGAAGDPAYDPTRSYLDGLAATLRRPRQG